jgi:uncharacterized membrane protein
MQNNFEIYFRVIVIITTFLIIDLILFNTAVLAQSQVDRKQLQQSVVSSFNTQGKGSSNGNNISNSGNNSFSDTIDIPKGTLSSKSGPFYLP